MLDTELFVIYDGNVMRWFAGNRSGSDPVGELSKEKAIEWAENKMTTFGCFHLNFTMGDWLVVTGM